MTTLAIGPPGDPLIARDHVQQAELRADAIVGPGFELEERVEIVGRRDTVEEADHRIAARDQRGAACPPHEGFGRGQLHPPRRPSSRRRTRNRPSMPPSIINVSAGPPAEQRVAVRHAQPACRRTPAPDRAPAGSCRCRSPATAGSACRRSARRGRRTCICGRWRPPASRAARAARCTVSLHARGDVEEGAQRRAGKPAAHVRFGPDRGQRQQGTSG